MVVLRWQWRNKACLVSVPPCCFSISLSPSPRTLRLINEASFRLCTVIEWGTNVLPTLLTLLMSYFYKHHRSIGMCRTHWSWFNFVTPLPPNSMPLQMLFNEGKRTTERGKKTERQAKEIELSAFNQWEREKCRNIFFFAQPKVPTIITNALHCYTLQLCRQSIASLVSWHNTLVIPNETIWFAHPHTHTNVSVGIGKNDIEANYPDEQFQLALC